MNKFSKSYLDLDRNDLIIKYSQLDNYYADTLCPVVKILYRRLAPVFRFIPKNLTLRPILLLGFVKLAVTIIADDGSRILDVGSGAERLSLYDGIPNVNVVGLDLRSGKDKRVIILDVEKEGALECFPKNHFNFIVLDQSLEHFVNPIKVLERLRPLLNDNGWLIVATPNVKSLPTKIFGKFWSVWEHGWHLTHYSKELLLEHIKLSGFTSHIIETYNISVFFFKSLRNIFSQKTSKPIEFTLTYHFLFPIAKILWLFLRMIGPGECVIVLAKKQPTSRKVDAEDSRVFRK